MNLLYEGDKLVRSILGTKQTAPGVVHRWSDYAVPYTLDVKFYLYNNFTKKLYQLDNAMDVNAEVRFTSDEINADNDLTQLVADSFLVPEDKDEAETYLSFCKIARAMKLKSKGYKGFTILPTTACNARCVYCFEQGMKYVTMDDDTVAGTVEFIKNVHKPGKPVYLHWFGGEPLVGEKIIDKICAALRDSKIEFISNMVTNSALINEKNLKKMKEDWNLKSMQITLDGVEDEYNRRKNYYFNYDSAYWHVLSRIKMVNDNDIRINIRVNVDEQNIDGVLDMAEDLKNFIVKPELTQIYLSPLFSLQESPEGIRVWKKAFDICLGLEKLGFKVGYHYSVTEAKVNFCMADSPYKNIVISPEGMLHNCEHVGAVPPLGDIWNGVTNTELLNKLASVEPVTDKCRRCFSLPYCTTFTGCDHVRIDCRYTSRVYMERKLERHIRALLKMKETGDESGLIEKDIENC